MAPEPLPSAAGAEHLTAALRRSGVLGEGCVREVAVESSRPTLLSRIIRLQLTYDRAVGAPRDLSRLLRIISALLSLVAFIVENAELAWTILHAP